MRKLESKSTPFKSSSDKIIKNQAVEVFEASFLDQNSIAVAILFLEIVNTCNKEYLNSRTEFIFYHSIQ